MHGRLHYNVLIGSTMPFFAGAKNVDARGGTYNAVQGDQHNYYGSNPSPLNRPNSAAGRPSYASNHRDPPSWASRNTEPPSWASQISGSSQISASYGRSNPPSPPPPEYKQPIYAQQTNGRFLAPQWIPADTSTLPSFSTIPSANSVLTSSTGKSAAIALIHREKLQTFHQFLDEALVDSSTDVPHLTDPKGWVEAEGEYITKIVQELASLAENDIILEHAKGVEGMVYPRLIVYFLAHLTFCASDNRALEDLKKTLRHWRNFDRITMIQNHLKIKDYLFDTCGKGLQTDDSMHPGSTTRKIVALDVIGLSAHLAIVVTEDDLYKQFYARRGPAAQALLDLLQARLDFYVDPQFKGRHVKALIKLSESSGTFPQCLVLSDVSLEDEPVAGGGFGDVFRGRLRGHEIAVKVLKVYKMSVVENLLREFAREAVTWRQLSHPNVLPFYGVYHLNKTSPRVCLVCPWMDKGNVVEYLAGTEAGVDCVILALDVAKGLEHLHSANIIHADLKGLNILITPSGRACLADFGLTTARDSKPFTQTYLSSTGHANGTLRWQAPELFPGMESTSSVDSQKHNTKATDVYAYAMTCYEMFSGIFPFQVKLVGDYQVIRAVLLGERPARPTDKRALGRGINDEIWLLVEACWDQDPHARPTAAEIVERLEGLPNRPVDTRPVDHFELSLLTKVLQARTEHPFATLVSEPAKVVDHVKAPVEEEARWI